jgi:ADP-ribosylglycohydrolase
MAGQVSLIHLLQEELIQRTQEGCDTHTIAGKIKTASDDERELNSLYNALIELQIQPGFTYYEPNDLADIKKERPASSCRLTASFSEAIWQDRFLGAWLGRCAGCALGKPLETGIFMHGSDSRPGWKNIQLWFEGADAWPISGYTPGNSRAQEMYGLSLNPGCKPCERENIRYMQTDDDIRYTVLGTLLLEERGLDFDTWDVAEHWQRWLTEQQVFTAEDRAYHNFALLTAGMPNQRPQDWQEKLDWVRHYRNPYREWIGAQIRADGWAYAAASNPQLAAELAWRDASLSHVKNGIYGEMYAAAMVAAAFVESEVEQIVQIGLGEIPQRSRLAADMHQAIEIAHTSQDQLELVQRLWQAFSHYDPVHTNNNAAVVTAALLWSGGDFEKGITTAVLGGWDTDCNGATVGSILGARLGAAALPSKWVEPLHDTLYAELRGFDPITISECALRSYHVFQKIQAVTPTADKP